jgi:fluoroacetyl-CoA thioesterase
LKSIYKPGDQKIYRTTVRKEDTAVFESGEVHPVYATFALARDAEWACRLFVLEMKEEDEEGIGSFISVKHLSPALPGEEVVFESTVKVIQKNEIICTYKATCGGRLIAEGEQGQKILKKEKLDRLFRELKEKQGATG